MKNKKVKTDSPKRPCPHEFVALKLNEATLSFLRRYADLFEDGDGNGDEIAEHAFAHIVFKAAALKVLEADGEREFDCAVAGIKLEFFCEDDDDTEGED